MKVGHRFEVLVKIELINQVPIINGKEILGKKSLHFDQWISMWDEVEDIN